MKDYQPPNTNMAEILDGFSEFISPQFCSSDKSRKLFLQRQRRRGYAQRDLVLRGL